MRKSKTTFKLIRGPSPKLRPEFKRDSQLCPAPTASHSSSTTQASAHESHLKLDCKLERSFRMPAAFTASKVSSGGEVIISGSFFRLFSRAQKHGSITECPLKCRPKPPIIRSRTDSGPSSLSKSCKVSTVQLVPAKDLDTLSKYWHFQNNFDRLVRRSYWQAEEIQCLLRCTKPAPSSICTMYGNLVSAHRALHDDLVRLHHYFKKEADLDEDLAHTLLEVAGVFMENFESLTARFQFACHGLRDIFENAVVPEGSLDCWMPDPRKVFSELAELRFTGIYWNLRRAIVPLMETIGSERRGRKHKTLEAVVVEPAEAQGHIQVKRN